MKRFLMTVVVVGLMAVVLTAVAQADNLNMTGTWQGVAPCAELKGGKYVSDQFAEPLTIIQKRDKVRMCAFGVVYEGVVQTLSGGPNDGEAVLSACGGTENTEVVRFHHIVTKRNGRGALDGTSNFASDALFPGKRTFGSCGWFYTRSSTDVGPCAPCNGN